MTSRQLLALARKRWGESAWLRDDRSAPDEEKRLIIRQELLRLIEEEPQAPPPTPEQLEYRKKHREWRDQRDRLRGRLVQDRWRVGTTDGAITYVKGRGDTLEEAAHAAGLL